MLTTNKTECCWPNSCVLYTDYNLTHLCVHPYSPIPSHYTIQRCHFSRHFLMRTMMDSSLHCIDLFFKAKETVNVRKTRLKKGKGWNFHQVLVAQSCVIQSASDLAERSTTVNRASPSLEPIFTSNVICVIIRSYLLLLL